jgi:hypothetical protein
MKLKFFTLALCLATGTTLMAQTPNGVIKKASVAPVIDGTVDDVWAEANSYEITSPYRLETPTVANDGASTWKGLYTDLGIYILVEVKDDKFVPVYAGASTEGWMFDKVEVYFNANADLSDAVGASSNGIGGATETNGENMGGGNGHYQFAPSPIDGEVDGSGPSTGTDNHGQPYGWKVIDPSYSQEFFIPFAFLLDKDNNEVDKTLKIGFDVTIIDNDTEDATSSRNRAVWANIGTYDESWTNMKECGTIVLDGLYISTIVAESVTVSAAGGATTIATDEGTLQMSADVLPADAGNKNVSWTVVNETGTAFISSTGLLHALTNGTVTVTGTTKDGSAKSASMQVTLTHQSINMADVSIVKNGDFLGEGAVGAPWNGGAIVTNGVAVCDPPAGGTNPWDWSLTQLVSAVPNVPYIFTFNAYADEDRTFNVDFEDSNNAYARYGTSTDIESTGESDWTFICTTQPTTYVFHVTFDRILENTRQSMQFMLGNADAAVYLDSVYLVAESDMEKITPLSVSNNNVSTFRIYPNPVVDKLHINLSAANSLVSIYNSVGRKMDEILVKGNKTTFDVSSYAKGLYFVKVNNDQVVKFVK